MDATRTPTTASSSPPASVDGYDARRLSRTLDEARDAYWEDPTATLGAAVRCQEIARTLGSDGLRARALAVQGSVTLNRGHLRGSFTLAAEADSHAERSGEDGARLEVAALKAQLSFFSGSYSEALRHAGAALEIADRTQDPSLRMFARRAACLVLGNLDAPGWREELDELVRLSVSTGHRWQEAISRNDLGHHLMSREDFAGAERELEHGMAIAESLAPRNRVALAVLHATRAELRLRTRRAGDALADAEEAIGQLTELDEPNPYLFGMSVQLEVQALLALGRPGDAQRCGERALERLGDRVPQARSMILLGVATSLREAGRLEDAYDALARGADLERRALQELTELQLGFERARLETKAARHEADALAGTNRELEQALGRLALANTELEERSRQLEAVQLREQADRDPLTGLHNRRYLMAIFAGLAREPLRGALSVAVFDLDRFKSVNDGFGHAAGDQVLVRTAALLRAVVRGADTIARTGGEEFVLLMPDTDTAAAAAVCERLLAALRDESWQRIGDGLRVTGSVGVATAPGGGEGPIDAEALTGVADRRLFDAKQAGRDRLRQND